VVLGLTDRADSDSKAHCRVCVAVAPNSCATCSFSDVIAGWTWQTQAARGFLSPELPPLKSPGCRSRWGTSWGPGSASRTCTPPGSAPAKGGMLPLLSCKGATVVGSQGHHMLTLSLKLSTNDPLFPSSLAHQDSFAHKYPLQQIPLEVQAQRRRGLQLGSLGSREHGIHKMKG
jgi:hypothetical protein